jgi:hypothetical protein
MNVKMAQSSRTFRIFVSSTFSLVKTLAAEGLLRLKTVFLNQISCDNNM